MATETSPSLELFPGAATILAAKQDEGRVPAEEKCQTDLDVRRPFRKNQTRSSGLKKDIPAHLGAKSQNIARDHYSLQLAAEANIPVGEVGMCSWGIPDSGSRKWP